MTNEDIDHPEFLASQEAKGWLWHAKRELEMAERLSKEFLVRQAAEHTEHGMLAAQRALRLQEIFQPGFIRGKTLVARRLRRYGAELEEYIPGAVKRFNTSERLLREVKPPRKPRR